MGPPLEPRARAPCRERGGSGRLHVDPARAPLPQHRARLHPALPASFSRTLVLGALLWVLSGAPASWGAPPPFLGLLVLGLAGKGMGRAVLGQQGWGRRSL